jgi:hypothetical protein
MVRMVKSHGFDLEKGYYVEARCTKTGQFCPISPGANFAFICAPTVRTAKTPTA